MFTIAKKLLNEIKSHPVIYFLLLATIIGGLIARTYNIGSLLGFYYDQGRDALIIWDMWHGGNIPFIGPTTGIAGIFRGPLYYYLIAPFYLMGKGDPTYPSVFLSITTVAATLLMYILGTKIQNRITGLIAAILSAFSFNIVLASRWLSNPTPMLLLGILFVLFLILIAEGKKWAWIWAVLIATVSLFHFGSAGEVFYFLTLAVLFIWQRKNLPARKVVFITIALSLLAIAPLIAFDIKNQGLISGNIQKFLITDKSFSLPTPGFIGDKLEFYYNVFTNKIFDARYHFEKSALTGILLFFVYHLHTLIRNKGVKVLLLTLGSVMFGLIFFQGNFGNIYDYYLTGYYLPFLLLFAIALGYMWKWKLGKIFVVYFIYLFLTNNFALLKPRLTDTGLGPNSISFAAQKQAIEWIRKDAGEEKYNVDVYVPPVIPYAYDYLFKWKGLALANEQVPLLYTLYEADSDHQDRLDAWMERQKGIATVKETEHFGAITVERRKRL